MRGWRRPPVMPACAHVSCRPPTCSSVSGRRSRCSPGWPGMPAGYSNVMPRHWWLPRTLLHSSSRPLLYAAAAEDAGAELARADRGGEAVDQLNAAFDTYMGHEALADARRVGRELRRLGVERRIVSQPRAKTGWDSLTDSELTVVNLIAQGATNRTSPRSCTFPSYGEKPRPQCVRQAGHQLPRPIDASSSRVIDHPAVRWWRLSITLPGLKHQSSGDGAGPARAATVVVVK